MTRLSAATVAQLPAWVERPRYDRRAVRSGVVHLGIGAFHRAHQALIFDRALAASDDRWGITAASLRSPAIRDVMAPQDWLYTLVERDGTGEQARVIGAVQQVLVAPERPAALVAALARPETHLVTLTVTEKGYLPAATPSGSAQPATAVDFLVAGLAARRAAGLPPFTSISCDNLPHNGARLRAAVIEQAAASDTALARWIETEAAFPDTMVDRMVPAPTPADRAQLAAATGLDDQAAVVSEPFLQWVIEDRFCGPRPAFETLGVQLTAAVAPWEQAKLRLLNGAHSAMAYIGGLSGISHVHQFVERPEGRTFIEALWDESATTLDTPPALDLTAYRAVLMQRFANPTLLHRTDQIAVDGSQKLPPRLLAPALARLERGLPIPALALAVAAWVQWLDGRDEAGTHHAIEDPFAGQLQAVIRNAGSARERVDAVLAMRAIVPANLAAQDGFGSAVTAALERIERQGVIGASRDLLHGGR